MTTLLVIGSVLLVVTALVVTIIHLASNKAKHQERLRHAEAAAALQAVYNEAVSRPSPDSSAERRDRWLGLRDS